MTGEKVALNTGIGIGHRVDGRIREILDGKADVFSI
jgi:hypothetical protein